MPILLQNPKLMARTIVRREAMQIDEVRDAEQLKKFEKRLESVDGNQEIYDLVFSTSADYPAMEY